MMLIYFCYCERVNIYSVYLVLYSFRIFHYLLKIVWIWRIININKKEVIVSFFLNSSALQNYQASRSVMKTNSAWWRSVFVFYEVKVFEVENNCREMFCEKACSDSFVKITRKQLTFLEGLYCTYYHVDFAKFY